MSARTGARVTTPESGLNPTFRRHVAAYPRVAEVLPRGGRVLDVGAGTGHSAALLAPRGSVAVDIDRYHSVEFDAAQLRDLCAPHFDGVELRGLFGSDRYGEIVRREHARLDALLARDPLRLRRLVPRRARQVLYDACGAARRHPDPLAGAITQDDVFRPASRSSTASTCSRCAESPEPHG